MAKEIKSGKQVLDEFFSEISNLDSIDKDISNILIKLYKEDKFTDKNLSNEISKYREEKLYGKNK